MSYENNSVEKSQGNPKKSPEYIKWKQDVIRKYKNAGFDISADEEYFILNLKDKNKNPYQIKIHAWEEIPVIRDKNQNTEGKPPTVNIEDIITAEILYAPQHSINERLLPMGEILDRFRDRIDFTKKILEKKNILEE